MGFYKTSSKTALDTWDNEINQCVKLKEQAEVFARKFGGKPVFTVSATYYHFWGLSFDSEPLIGHNGLWVEALPQNQFTRWPRAKGCAPQEICHEHQQLLDAWDDGRPREFTPREPYWKALGLEWEMIVQCGTTHFRAGDVIYFKTTAKPSGDSGAMEIIESEYLAAEKLIS